MEKDFNDIFDRLTYQMFIMSNGNPYIAHDWVKERNLQRAIEKKRLNEKEL